MNDMTHEMIPCEFCGDMVTRQLYHQHAIRCQEANRAENIHEDMYYEGNELEGFITRNYQVHRTNVRDFLETHRSPSNESYIQMASYIAHQKQKKPVSIVDINQFSVIVTKEGFLKDDGICPICQNDIKDLGEKGIKLRKLTCLHVFCHTCISKWIEKNNTCPICLQRLYKNSV